MTIPTRANIWRSNYGYITIFSLFFSKPRKRAAPPTAVNDFLKGKRASCDRYCFHITHSKLVYVYACPVTRTLVDNKFAQFGLIKWYIQVLS